MVEGFGGKGFGDWARGCVRMLASDSRVFQGFQTGSKDVPANDRLVLKDFASSVRVQGLGFKGWGCVDAFSLG